MIHPTAIVDATAEIEEGVEIGPHCLVEADVRIGAGTVLRPNAILRQYTTLGKGNFVDSFAVLGGLPQDLKFQPRTVSYLRIGDGNTFREGVTISRATGEGAQTRVGNRTYWMANSHAGHNVTVEDEAMLVNGSMVGGHATVGRRATLSGNVAVHQFCWIGELVMTQGQAAMSTHVPPFVMVANINRVVGLNKVGLQRCPYITEQDRQQIKEAFRLTYRSGRTPQQVVEDLDRRTDLGAACTRYREFLRRVLQAVKPYARGLCQRRRGRETD
jgi:UDP-N-acetylglucosamine acyltransferase